MVAATPAAGEEIHVRPCSRATWGSSVQTPTVAGGSTTARVAGNRSETGVNTSQPPEVTLPADAAATPGETASREQ